MGSSCSAMADRATHTKTRNLGPLIGNCLGGLTCLQPVWCSFTPFACHFGSCMQMQQWGCSGMRANDLWCPQPNRQGSYSLVYLASSMDCFCYIKEMVRKLFYQLKGTIINWTILGNNMVDRIFFWKNGHKKVPISLIKESGTIRLTGYEWSWHFSFAGCFRIVHDQ
jgi:hypothetical protein